MDFRTLLIMFAALVGPPRGSAAAPPDAAALANRVDGHLAAAWSEARLAPAPLAGDAAFLRRASLDLIGRIPTVAETREFLSDPASDKRARLIDRLLASGGYTRHWAVFWRRSWIPQTDTQQFARLADDFERWLAGRLRDEIGYDRLVEELLTVPSGRAGPAQFAAHSESTTPKTFLEASETRPENLAANASRAFLGINLDCAQCHDHPFSRWTRDEFWQTAAFFAQPQATSETTPVAFRLPIPDTSQVATPKLLDGQLPAWPEQLNADTGRKLLARWTVAADNPYFARNAANRIWANLFGLGLIEPLDDLSGENPASHPELLDKLTEAFKASGFDLKYLTKALMLSKAYQLSCAAPNGDADSQDPSLFASMAVRGLSGEQLYDSLRVAAGLPVERHDLGISPGLDARQQFATQFRVERASHAQRSIVQALSLMNGELTVELTSPEKSPTLGAVADAPFFDTRGKVDALFLAALGRPPGDDEAGPLVAYVEQRGVDGQVRKALSDVFWSLLNSSEFNTNH
ncbi:MAG TPA: DUF1549 and DUF1553 domain-containing protein [Pirellulales bacterium]|nr:DUF1549 and DUF1553 domain-containing protein [Pirellulales bacterium]